LGAALHLDVNNLMLCFLCKKKILGNEFFIEG
jgi:hypothetical protein